MSIQIHTIWGLSHCKYGHINHSDSFRGYRHFSQQLQRSELYVSDPKNLLYIYIFDQQQPSRNKSFHF